MSSTLHLSVALALTDKNARDLKGELKTTMEDIGMVTVGMYNLYWCFCMYFLSRKCSRSIYTVFSWLWKFFVVLHNINLVLFIKGYVTDGEFNSLRTQGTNRPVSVIHINMTCLSHSILKIYKAKSSFVVVELFDEFLE